MIRVIGTVRSKLYCVLWLLTHGFLPQKYFWWRVIPFKGVTHSSFSYGKFVCCGKTYAFKKWGKDSKTYTNGIWDFPEQLIDF